MKRTFQPSNLVRARRHGFFARKATPGGRKVLAIRLDNPPASARWYPGGGLYRDRDRAG